MKTERRFEPTRTAGHGRHRFHGGLKLRHHKKISCRQAVERPPLPDALVVPLVQHAGETSTALVKAGDKVLKGQVIGQCEPCAAIHSPVSGRVEAVEARPMSHPSGEAGPCVVIRPDGEERWVSLQPVSDWRNAGPERLIKQFRDCGIAGLGGAVFPTHAKTHDGRERSIHTLVLNGAECEPYISCDEMLMREQAAKVVQGGSILCRALGAERVIIAVEDQMGAVRAALLAAIENAIIENSGGPEVSVARVAAKYPEGGERQLVKVLTGLEVPAGGRPSDLGMVCQNVATAAAIAEAVLEGKPLIERYVTVTGNGISGPRNLKALIGTPFSHLVEHCGGYTGDVARLVIGGPMMGYAVASDDNPVVKACNCLLALSSRDIATPQREMPCIRCGECARVCPASLLPQQLQLQVRNGLWQQAQEYGLAACIECGCCDFVCPSHIPLTQWFRYGKGEQKMIMRERAATDLARQRFEAREERLSRLRREQAAKMAERKKMLRDKALRQADIRAAIERAANRSGQGRDSENGNDSGDT